MNFNHNEISSLVQRVKQNDSQAFALLYERTYQKTYFLALSILKNEYDAQDAVQETFVKILASIYTLENENLYIAWSNRITYHICLRMLEKHRDFLDERNPADTPPDLDIQDDPLTDIIQNDQKRKLFQAVQQLDPVLRTTIFLKYFENMKVSEISLIMECPVGTVKSRLHTAKKRLLYSMGRDGSLSMLVGVFCMVPLRGIYRESAQGVGMSSEAAFNIFGNCTANSSLTQQGIAFIPTASAGVYATLSGGIKVGIIVCISAISVTVVAAASISLAAPTIAQVTVPEPYISPTATILVETKGLVPVTDFYAVAPDGTRVASEPREDGTFELQVNENGDYMIYAVSENQKQASQTVSVDCIDIIPPKVVSFTPEDELLHVFFSDTQSGTDLNTTYGVLSDGTRIFPLSVDTADNSAIFPLEDEGFMLYVADTVGNISENKVIVTTNITQFQ